MRAERLEVDGRRPAVARVAGLPREFRLSDAEWRVLVVLACDSYDGLTAAPGLDNLAAWTGLMRGTVASALARLSKPTPHRPALLVRAYSTRGRNRTEWRLTMPEPEPSDEAGRMTTASTVNEPSDDTGRSTDRQPSTNRPEPQDGQPSTNRPARPDTPSSPARSLHPAAAAATNRADDDPLAEYGLTAEHRVNFLAFIGAKGEGLLHHLARNGQLAVRIAEWQTAQDARHTGPRSIWDTLPNVTDMRLAGRLHDEEMGPLVAPGRAKELMREARARARRTSEAELLSQQGPRHCAYCGTSDYEGHLAVNCVPYSRALYDGLEPTPTHCTDCGELLPCTNHEQGA